MVMEKINIMVVDDHQIFRTGLILLLNEIEYIGNIQEASDGEEVFDVLEKGKIPDIILMDIKMPKMNGIDATAKVLEKYPKIKIVALSMHDEEKYLDSMLRAGAKGFLSKKVGLEDLEKAIKRVYDGKNYFSEDLMNILVQKITPSNKGKQVEVNLTKREKEILKHIASGSSNQEIAEKLFISQRTVESHRANLLEKTNSKNSINLVIFAIRNNLIEI